MEKLYLNMTKEDLNKTVGNNIRLHRRKRQLSMDQLSDLISISSSFLGLVERGQRGLGLENIITACIIFGIAPNDILCDSVNPRKHNITPVFPDGYDESLKSIISGLIVCSAHDKLNTEEIKYINHTIHSYLKLKKGAFRPS